jgi:radical SAM superfamily enzyme YgiQ (UPF0313 family)
MQNLGRDYQSAIDRLHALGIMINGSFVFGLDGDTPDVFERTVDWAVERGITTATFHIATPYPDTGFFSEMEDAGRMLTRDWNLYDTRHVVFEPRGMTAEELKAGYDSAYEQFYRWSAIVRSSLFHGTTKHKLKHFFYAGGWKKFEPAWNAVIQMRQLGVMTPMLEAILSRVSRANSGENRTSACSSVALADSEDPAASQTVASMKSSA